MTSGTPADPTTYGVVLFDLDGTLVDTVALILASFRHATGVVLGEPLPDEVLMCDVGIPLAKQMSSFSVERADELLAVYREHNARVHDELIAEYPGVKEGLVALTAAGKRLGVVTSKSRPLADRALTLFGLTDHFEVVVTCEDVERHKPDPDPIIEAARLLGVRAEDCVYVGDSPHDMTAALSAGSLAIAALWGAFPEERVTAPGPHFRASSMKEVVDLLLGEGTCKD